MAVCDQCGNDYDKAFRVLQKDRSWTFDSFECAFTQPVPIRTNRFGFRTTRSTAGGPALTLAR